ncbi:hypothetical protein H0W80_04135 [Candidatus Saccharibacteria bacterium]|nr:hypothetical protein [Candidatus Saccharibacteria bacterium]
MAKNYDSSKKYSKSNYAGGGAVYGIGLIGALIYYMQHANTFWLVLVGLFKAVTWPAYVVYGLLRLFNL